MNREREPQLRRPDLAPQPLVRAVRVGFHCDMRQTPPLRALVDFAVAEFERQSERLCPPDLRR